MLDLPDGAMRLVNCSAVDCCDLRPLSLRRQAEAALPRGTSPALNAAQAHAVAAVVAQLGKPGAFLLDGVTGSGKTEVYLRTRG